MVALIRKLILGIATVATLSAVADTYTITATDTGFYYVTGYHDPANSNYLAGSFVTSFVSPTNVARNWLIFDLSSLPPGTIATASLTLYNPAINDIYGSWGNGYRSTNSFETYRVGSISTPINSLRNGTGGTAAFDGIGTGDLWGSRRVTAADNGTLVTVTLNPAFDSSAERLLGTASVALGGTVIGDTTFTISTYVFGFTGYEAFGAYPPLPTLTLEVVPAPLLTIVPTGNTAVVSWPSSATGFVIEQNTTLDQGSWGAPTETTADDGTHRFIVVSLAFGSRFFRLIKH